MATDISTEQTATIDRTSGGDDRSPDTATTSATRPSRFAQRTAAYGSSIWTDIFNLFKRHTDPIYFGDGSPAKEAIPLDLLQEGSRHSWEHAIDALGYGDQQGFPPLRELIAQHMRGLGADVSPDTVLVTAGSTQAIDLTSKILLDPGDVVIVEEPTFLGALETFETYEARLVGVPVDEHGMDMDALEAVLAAEPRAKFIYTIPTFQNPTGTTMSIERRHRLIQLARAHGVEILEDDPYVDLRYEGEAVPPLRALDDRVIYLGTFSKTIAPGVRTGWVTAPPDIFRLLLAAREISDISNDRIAQRTVYHTAANGLDERVARARDIYRSRRDAMLAALDEFMPEGVIWSHPDGGFFVWITLPSTFDVNTFATRAADFGTVVFPGDWFYHARDVTNTIRLSFSTVPEDRIREGVRRLADAIRAERTAS